MMKSPLRLIFRPEMVKRYIQEREQTILPRHLAPPFFAMAWVLLGIMLVVLLFACWTKIPIFTSATAIVQSSPSDSLQTEPFLMILLPVSYRTDIHQGQQVYYTIPGSTELSKCIITMTDSTILNPKKADALFGKYHQAGIRINEPVSIAYATIKRPSGNTVDDQAGSILSVKIITGHQRLISLIPFLGKFFKTDKYIHIMDK
ncbi:MAG TPA: hypothetical protein VF399_09930 [bacterium]|jgi:hypothetical protein